MKFGIVLLKNTQNIGDDIQSFAAANLLPSADYFIDRETFDSFRTENDEPVAVVMSAWYMWSKWNWPPSRYIVPLYTGMHWADHQIANQDGSPVKTEFLTGIGGEYLNAYAPIGCRDMPTLESFKSLGIDAYFSGCITLTLPEMPRIKPEKEYICCVDVEPYVMKQIRKLLEGRDDLELREITHYKDYRNSDASWEERKKAVTDLLTVYQNAKCVITRRLHCALPCLAMNVPVLLFNSRKPSAVDRFVPYFDWIHNCKRKDFINGSYKYDITNPPPNNGGHIETRNKLIKTVTDFAEKYKNASGSYKDYDRLKYSDEEVIKWRHDTMKRVMYDWLMYTRNDFQTIKTLEAENQKSAKALDSQKKKSTAELEKLKQEIKRLKAEAARLKADNERLRRILNCRPVKTTIKLRNAFLKDSKKIKL